MSQDGNFKLKYSIKAEAGDFTPVEIDEAAKADDNLSAADALIVLSILERDDGQLEMLMHGIDGRTGKTPPEDLPISDLFNAWVSMGLMFAEAPELSEDQRYVGQAPYEMLNAEEEGPSFGGSNEDENPPGVH